MIYLDANFFVFAVVDNTRKGEKAREIQADIISGKLSAFTSVLALDEVMWVLKKNNKSHLLRKTIEDIYATPNIIVREVPSLTALHALNNIDNFNLRPRDAFHLAIMEYLQIITIVSDDADFDKIKTIKRMKLE